MAAQLETWATALYAHATELAAVHRHNRPLLAAIAAKYNQMEFAIETVEIGVIATDDGLTWANTETRDTLGKTQDGWWLELQQYGAERVVPKQYTHIAAVWQAALPHAADREPLCPPGRGDHPQPQPRQ